MPKIIFEKTEKELIPEHLRDKAKETEDGTFELDAKPVLDKNKQLLGKNSSLSETITELEAERDEWKGKAKIPNGQKIVPADVAELGEAAKEAGIVKDEMPTLKTKAEELQGKLDGFENEKSTSAAAAALGYKGAGAQRFIDLSRDRKVKYEIGTEGEGENAKQIVSVIKDGGAKEKLNDDFMKSTFGSFVETFSDDSEGGDGFSWIKQESGAGSKTEQSVAKSRMKNRYGQKKE